MPPVSIDPTVALANERAALDAMPADQVKEPPYPPQFMIGEANALAEVGNRYKGALVAVGLDPALLEGLLQRAQALAGAQAARALVRETKRSAEELATEEVACEVRKELFDAGRYATRANAQAQSTLGKISDGTGLDDLIQDLRELALFATTYNAELTAIAFSAEAFKQRALEIAGKLERHLAERRTRTDAERAATDLRNRAATHLFAAMAEIRDAGTYAFRKEPNVLPLFRSGYRRRHRKGKGGGEKETPTQ